MDALAYAIEAARDAARRNLRAARKAHDRADHEAFDSHYARADAAIAELGELLEQQAKRDREAAA